MSDLTAHELAFALFTSIAFVLAGAVAIGGKR